MENRVMHRDLQHAVRRCLFFELKEMQYFAKPYDPSSSQHIYNQHIYDYLDFRASSGLDREPRKNGG